MINHKEICNDIWDELNQINDNFLTLKSEPKMKVELIQKTTLTDMYYKILVDGALFMTYSNYEDALIAYNGIKISEPREEVLLSKEI